MYRPKTMHMTMNFQAEPKTIKKDQINDKAVPKTISLLMGGLLIVSEALPFLKEYESNGVLDTLSRLLHHLHRDDSS